MEHSSTPADSTLLAIIQGMTLAEKAALCSGLDAWHTKPYPAHGIPSLHMADGPHGVRVEDRKNRKAHGGNSKPATCFPAEVCLACGWSPTLAHQVGAAIAKESLHHEVGLLLGPGANIKRHPLNGRNFEYYSEDPRLSGTLAAGFIRGVQENGVGTALKHFAVNNQEYQRMSINAVVDERALFDLYLKPFEIAIKKAQPDTVMASYNQVNGAYATENRRLLTDILRLQFGFTGVVMSDWGAVNNRPAGIAAGMDLEMPPCGSITDWQIEQAVTNGALSETDLDTACWNLLRLVFRRNKQGQPAPKIEWAAHHTLASTVAEKCAVLLKNDDMLPLEHSNYPLAVIGEMAAAPRYQGSGSSVMTPTKITSFLDAMTEINQPFVYAAGYSGTKPNNALVQQAVKTAKSAKQVVLYLGLPDAFETEGCDREHLRLPPNQLQLLDAVVAANPTVCVVLCCGGPVETPWLGKIQALLCPHLTGQAHGTAVMRLLYGQANPAGKLAETWPLALEDTPAHHHFPMGPRHVTHNESIFVGYRYYLTAKKKVRFPFGFGLSYTQYQYMSISLSCDEISPEITLTAHVTVLNTGKVNGEEIIQLYLARNNSATFHPVRELLAFERVFLAAGEEKTIDFSIPYSELAFYVPAFGKPVVENGTYTLLAGANSLDLPLAVDFTANGATLPAHNVTLAHYNSLSDNTFPDDAFSTLYGAPLPNNTLPKKGFYAADTPLSQMGTTFTGRALQAITRLISRRVIHFSPDKTTNRRTATQMAKDLPFKNLMLNAGGLLSPKASDALLSLCNGKGGVGRFLGGLLGKKPYRR